MRTVRLFVAAIVCLTVPVHAQVNMPNPKEISGVPLPANEIPIGTLTVRVIRGGFDKNLKDVPVAITVNGRARTVNTNESGRAEVHDLPAGAKVKAVAAVDGERLESQEITMGGTGIRVVLVATDPEIVARESEDKRLASGPAVKGAVVFGPESRVIAEMSGDQLNVFYILEVLNTGRTPVDIGGPLLIDLPTGARGGGMLDGSSPRATVNGPRVTVTGPFAPGATSVHVGFEMPYAGPRVRIAQTWPAALPQVRLLVPKLGGLDVQSPHVTSKREVVDQGQTLILGSGPAMAAGETFVLEITGLPYHPRWPRNVALGTAGVVVLLGLWTAFGPASRRRFA